MLSISPAHHLNDNKNDNVVLQHFITSSSLNTNPIDVDFAFVFSVIDKIYLLKNVTIIINGFPHPSFLVLSLC